MQRGLWIAAGTIFLMTTGLAPAQEANRNSEEALLMLYIGTRSSEKLAEEAWKLIADPSSIFLRCAESKLSLLRSNMKSSDEYVVILNEIESTTDNIAKSRVDDRASADQQLMTWNRGMTGKEADLYDRASYTISQIIFLKSVLDVLKNAKPTFKEWLRSIVSQRLSESREAIGVTLEGTEEKFWRFVLPKAKKDYPFLLCTE
jgi:hypothetical protein